MTKQLLAIVSSVLLALMFSASAFAQLPSPCYGWNLGNTLEAPDGEGTWSPLATQRLINAVADSGFNTIRLPVAWDSHANQSNHQIDAVWMARVKQVVDWCHARNVTVIVNCHWDRGWLENNITDTVNPTINAKMQSYWSQIANTFKTYDNRLLFAGTNEPDAETAAQWNTLLAYQQTFVNAVRATGGNNSNRWLVIQGPKTDIDRTDKLLSSLPSDSASGRLAVEIHYYDPFSFTLQEKDETWGKMFYFWGQSYHHATRTDRNATFQEEAHVDAQFQKMADKFVSRGIPVIIGEFAARKRTRQSDLTGTDLSLHLASRTYFHRYVVKSANSRGLKPIYWDYAGLMFDWSTGTITDKDTVRALTGGPALPPPPRDSVAGPQAVASAASSVLAPKNWVTTGPLVHPIADERHPIVAVKDPSVVFHDGRWHIFATTAGSNGWGMAHFSFSDWSKAREAKTFHLDNNPHLAGYNCAPQVFYFRPQKKWYLIFQSPQPRFSTTDDIGDPMSWSAPQNFFEGTPKSVVEGWLDYWIICDDTHAYLFFPDDHGRIYRSRTTHADFPRGFDEPVVIMHEAKNDLFEGSCVYRIKGTNQFLLLVECIGKQGSRYYRAFVTDRLDGEWKPLPGANTEETPFAGNANVRTTNGSPLWADGVSHGELLREGSDETMTLDPKNLRFLYQGLPRGTTEPNYLLLPYRLALLKPAEAAPAK